MAELPGKPASAAFAWDPPLARERRRRRRPVLIAGGIGLALIGLASVLDHAVRPAPRLVWNASPSAPVGLWRIYPHVRPRTGDMVLVRMPPALRDLAAERHYLPVDVPLLKRIVARDGHDVCAFGHRIFVDGKDVARRRAADRLGRRLPWWEGCERLRDGRVFLLMDNPDSFDGRYFGPIGEGAVIGKATPLWLR